MMPHAGRRRRRRIDETGNGRTGTHPERAPPAVAAAAPEEQRLKLLERAVEGARILLLVLDADGVILLAEGGGVAGLGLSPEAAVGRSVFEVCDGDIGLTDAVRAILPDQPGVYSFWDYQAGAWQKDNGIRIDHFLLSPQAADRLTAARIDKHVRGWEKPSDHVPVVISLS